MGNEVVSYEFNSTKVDPSLAVVDAMSRLTERSETDLPPLSNTIDPDSLNTICGDGSSDSTHPKTVSFVYVGVRVTVTGDGAVFLDEDLEG